MAVTGWLDEPGHGVSAAVADARPGSIRAEAPGTRLSIPARPALPATADPVETQILAPIDGRKVPVGEPLILHALVTHRGSPVSEDRIRWTVRERGLATPVFSARGSVLAVPAALVTKATYDIEIAVDGAGGVVARDAVTATAR